MFRAVVLADAPMLTVNEFPQIAAHVEGYAVTVPPAPAPKDLSTAHRGSGDARRIRQARPPPFMCLRPTARDAVGIPAFSEGGDIRSLEAVEADMIRLAFGRYRGTDDGDCQEARHRPLDALPQDARDRPRGESQINSSARVCREAAPGGKA